MNKKELLFLIIVISPLLYSCNASGSGSKKDEYLLEELKLTFCANREYVQCLELETITCNQIMTDTFNQCPTLRVEDFDTQILDIKCINNQLVKHPKMSEELMTECDSILK